MSIITSIILILFIFSLCAQWVASLVIDAPRWQFLFGFEIVAFGYLCVTLMGG